MWTMYYLVLPLAGWWIWARMRRCRLPYPPGPPAEPVLGHLRIMPLTDQEAVYRKWSKKYGDILYFHFLGRSYLVLNSLKVATELLDKRSGIYSDRMDHKLYELMGWYPTLAILPYGKRFQKHRRLMQAYLHQKRCLSYRPLQTQLARRLLLHLLEDPRYTIKFSATLIVKIVYGMDISSDDDHYIDIAVKALDTMISCGSIGSTPVDFMPFLRYLPSWFPGTYYAFKARSFYPLVREMHEYPFNSVKTELMEGTAQPSFLSHYLGQLNGKFDDRDHIDDLKGSACMMYGGGVETTTNALSFFLLAMVLFPESQKKAQREIDDFLGRERLPDLSDRKSLPYVEAVMQEVFRWNTMVPSGLPHRSIADDVYNGMFIPKGTVIIPNAYAILRDESIYSDPDSFNPDRYLPKPVGSEEPYPIGHFGFGRRICVGQHLAEPSIWIVIASVLATLDIVRLRDETGKEIVPKVELINGLSSHPKPFPFSIRPRDTASENLIRQAHIWD